MTRDNIFIRYLPLLLLAMLWEIAPRVHIVDPSELPPLSAVAVAWWSLLIGGDLWSNGVSSFINWSFGLGSSILVGIALGVMMAWSTTIDDIASPLVKALYPMPKSALIPVMILWLGLGAGSKIASIALSCLLPVIISAYNGARGVDQTLIWSARACGASNRNVLWEVILPGALPDIMAGIRNAVAISFIVLVASELLVGQKGLGYLISFLGEGGVYDAMFAVVITVSALGFFADRAYLYFMRRTLVWRE
ncbi:MAG TPA: ABC transporter permease [Stellaceae bacterium]|jgi:NitT/TauT family transport system permease protein|nr:ABC transporter permease [Stellaceae bacterium]